MVLRLVGSRKRPTAFSMFGMSRTLIVPARELVGVNSLKSSAVPLPVRMPVFTSMLAVSFVGIAAASREGNLIAGTESEKLGVGSRKPALG